MWAIGICPLPKLLILLLYLLAPQNLQIIFKYIYIISIYHILMRKTFFYYAFVLFCDKVSSCGSGWTWNTMKSRLALNLQQYSYLRILSAETTGTHPAPNIFIFNVTLPKKIQVLQITISYEWVDWIFKGAWM